LKCFVGKGNSSIVLPATESEMSEHEEKQTRSTEFQIKECGKRGSKLLSPDFKEKAKEVLRNIKDAAKNALEKAKEAVGADRRKKREADEEEEDKFACGKVVIGEMAYR